MPCSNDPCETVWRNTPDIRREYPTAADYRRRISEIYARQAERLNYLRTPPPIAKPDRKPKT